MENEKWLMSIAKAGFHAGIIVHVTEACYHGGVMPIADADVPSGWQEWVNNNGVPYYEHTQTVSSP